MSYTNPTVADFKAQFVRDFPYQPALPTPVDLNKYIQDSDITSALNLTAFTINEGLFDSQEFYTYCFLLLSAHYLVEAIKAGGAGMSGIYEWAVASKAVGSVSISFSIPENILKVPFWSMLTKDNYGARYLELILPLLTGPMFVACGGTQA